MLEGRLTRPDGMGQIAPRTPVPLFPEQDGEGAQRPRHPGAQGLRQRRELEAPVVGLPEDAYARERAQYAIEGGWMRPRDPRQLRAVLRPFGQQVRNAEPRSQRD